MIKDIFAILFLILTLLDILLIPVSIIGAIWTLSFGGSSIFYFWLKMIPISLVAAPVLIVITKILLEMKY